MADDKISQLYQALKSDENYSDVIPDENKFRQTLSDSAKANQFFDALHSDKNYSEVIPKDFNSFSQKLGLDYSKTNVPQLSEQDLPTGKDVQQLPKMGADAQTLFSKSDNLVKGFADKVMPYIEKRINDNPDDVDALYQMGRAKLLQKDYNTALDIFTGLSAKDPENKDYLQGLANAQYYAGQQKEGLKTQGEAQSILPESKSVEDTETERLKPFQDRLNAASKASELIASPFTSGMQSINEGFNSLEKSGEEFEKGNYGKGFLKGVQGVLQGAIGTTMSSSAGGLIFNSAVALADEAGTPTGKILAPSTNLPNYENFSDEAKTALSFADLILVGVAMHKLGKPFSEYKEVAKLEPEKLQAAIEEAKQSTPQEQQATLQHLDNPEGAKIEAKKISLNNEVENLLPVMGEDAKTLFAPEIAKTDEALANQTKDFTDKSLQEAEDQQKIDKLEQALPLTKTGEGKKIITDQLNKLKPKEDAINQEQNKTSVQEEPQDGIESGQVESTGVSDQLQRTEEGKEKIVPAESEAVSKEKITFSSQKSKNELTKEKKNVPLSDFTIHNENGVEFTKRIKDDEGGVSGVLPINQFKLNQGAGRFGSEQAPRVHIVLDDADAMKFQEKNKNGNYRNIEFREKIKDIAKKYRDKNSEVVLDFRKSEIENKKLFDSKEEITPSTSTTESKVDETNTNDNGKRKNDEARKESRNDKGQESNGDEAQKDVLDTQTAEPVSSIVEKDFITKPKAGGGFTHDLNDGDIRVVEKADGKSYVETKGEKSAGLNNTGYTRELNITDDFDNVKDAKEFALKEANKGGETEKSVESAIEPPVIKSPEEVKAVSDANRIAKAAGFSDATHALNSLRKRGYVDVEGKSYERVQDVPKADLKKIKVERTVDEKVKKTIATVRAYEGEVREGVKKQLEELGLTREIEKQSEAKTKAKEFVKQVGEETALEAVRNNDVPDAAAAYIWNDLIENVNKKLATETDPAKVAELEKMEAQLFDEFGKKALSGGRFSSALSDIYKNSDLGYNLQKKIQEYKDLNKGEIPADVEARFREYDKQIKELNKRIVDLEDTPKEVIKTEARDKKIRQSLSSEKLERKKELSKKYRNSLNDVGRVVTLIGEKEFREYAGLVLEEAAGDFRIFAKEMINNVGKQITEHLPKLYEELLGKTRGEQEKIKRLEKKLTELRGGKTGEKKIYTEDSKEVKELKQEITEAKKELGLFASKRLPELAMTDVEKYKNRLQKQIEEYQRRLTDKDFGKKEKKYFVEDTELRTLKAEKIKWQERFDKELYRTELKNRKFWAKAQDAAVELFSGLSRTLVASLDFSAVLVQGLIRTATKPKQSIYALGEMFKQFASEKKHQEYIQKIKAQEWYPEMKESKLYLAESDVALNAREEQFISGWINKIWDAPANLSNKVFKETKGAEWWKALNPYKASERAYTGYLNAIRVKAYLEGANNLEQQGKTFSANKEEYQAWAKYVNNATGRGSLGRFEESAKTMQTIFFSPRKIAARINLINPVFYAKLTPSARVMALKNFGSFLAVSVATAGLAKAAGAKVSTNPNSADFMKIRIGNTRIDLWGGFQQEIVALCRLYNNKKISTTTGKTETLGGRFGASTRWTIVEDFFINKFAPSPALATKWAKGLINEKADKTNNPMDITPEDVAIQSAIPMWLQGTDALYKDQSPEAATALKMLSIFGGGVQTYK